MKSLTLLSMFTLMCGSPGQSSSDDVAASLTVTPEALNLQLGESGSATCEPLNDLGAALDGACSWVSRDPAIAMSTSDSETSIITARGIGSVWVVATSSAVNDSVRVTITDTLPPPMIGIAVGESWQAKVDANPDGAVFQISAGTHKGQSVVPKNGNQFIGEPGAVMDGENQTPYAFHGGGTGVTIKGLVIRGYSPPVQLAAVMVGTNWLIESNEITESKHSGLRMGPKSIARNNNIHHNHMYGVNGVGDGILVENNTIAHNNYLDEFDRADEGGTKFVFTTNLVLRNNWVHHNRGPGLWTDIDNDKVLVEGNTVEDNEHEGIFHEIGWSATIRNNVVRRNGFGRTLQAEGAGIYISSSGGDGTEIYGNTLEGNKEGITLIQANRGSGIQGVYLLKNVSVHHNTITLTGAQNVGAQTYGSLSLFAPEANNHFEDNTYHLQRASLKPFLWNRTALTESQWQALGHDSPGGTFNR